MKISIDWLYLIIVNQLNNCKPSTLFHNNVSLKGENKNILNQVMVRKCKNFGAKINKRRNRNILAPIFFPQKVSLFLLAELGRAFFFFLPDLYLRFIYTSDFAVRLAMRFTRSRMNYTSDFHDQYRIRLVRLKNYYILTNALAYCKICLWKWKSKWAFKIQHSREY